MDKNIDRIEWMRNELIPSLIKDCKFPVDWNDGASSKLVDCEIKPLTVSDAFMMTNCFKIKVILSDATGDQEKEYGIIVKASPAWVTTLPFSPFEILFKNEIIAYKELLSAMKWMDYTAKYYYSHIKENGESLIALSDFTLDGYRMSKAKGKLSLEHIYEAVKLIGKFHGYMYAFKHTDIDSFNKIKDSFKEARYIEGKIYEEPWPTIGKNGVKRAIETARNNKHIECKEISDEFLNKLENLIAVPQEYQISMSKSVEPFALLCHGDYLRNNIAFKYCDEECTTPEKATMFDFQTFRYTSPMADLSTFMANSTGTDVRSKHFDYIFQTYHSAMVDNYCSLTKKSIEEIPEFMSYESMLLEYVRYLPFGLSIASGFVSICLEPFTIDDSWMENISFEEVIEREYKRGGEIVNRELRALVYEAFNFYKKYNLELQ